MGWTQFNQKVTVLGFQEIKSYKPNRIFKSISVKKEELTKEGEYIISFLLDK